MKRKNIFNIFILVFLLIFLFSSCIKPVKSKFQIKVNISFSTQTKTMLNKDINEASGEVILRLDSPLANIGKAHLNIINSDDGKNVRTVDLNPLNENTYSGTFTLNQTGHYEIQGVFSLGGEDFTSENKLYINVYDYKKELEPKLEFKNAETGELLNDNLFDPYRNYSILVSIDPKIEYNSDFSYKIFFDNSLLEEGNLKNKSFESTPVLFKNKKHTISVEVYDTTNNGFGRTTVDLIPKDIDTSFNIQTTIHKNSYAGPILSNDSTLSTVDPLYIVMNIVENYSLPASYLFEISNDDGTIKDFVSDKKDFKYGPIYLDSGDVNLFLTTKNLITNDSTQNKFLFHVEKFEEFNANVDIYKKDYLDKNIKINENTVLTNRDPVFFKVAVNKNRDFSDELNYNFILKKDGLEYKKLDITTNSTDLETEKMYLPQGNYELKLVISKNDPLYSKEYYKTFKVTEAINNFDLNYYLIQKNSDASTTLYYIPAKIFVDPESTKLNNFDIHFNVKSNYSYPATYIYSLIVNENEIFKSNPVQSRDLIYSSYQFPEGHNYVHISSKDIDSNYSANNDFEVLVKENNPPELYKVSVEGTTVYSKESTDDFYNLSVSSSEENPRILIEFKDQSEIVKRDYININVKILENGTDEVIPIYLSPDQESKRVKYSGILNGLTLDSTQTWEIKIDPSQIVDEFGNTYADEFENIYYTINFKTK
jgi:hypothetical protein